MAARVVHLLEAVEVEAEHREARAGPPAQADRLRDPVVELRPVGEAGQPVMMGEVADPRLGPLALGHVGEGADRAVVGQDAGSHLKHGAVGPGALIDGVGELDATRLRQPADFLVVIELAVAELPAQDVVEARPSRDEAGRQAEQLDGAAVDHRDPALRIHHEDALAHVLQGVCQHLLGPQQPLLGAQESPPAVAESLQRCQYPVSGSSEGRDHGHGLRNPPNLPRNLLTNGELPDADAATSPASS